MYDNYVQGIDEILETGQGLCLRWKMKNMPKLCFGSSGSAVSSHG